MLCLKGNIIVEIKHINQNAHSDSDIILAVQSILCAKNFQNHFIFSRFLKEESEISIR